ncbi:hypothetical protein BvCmsHHP056_04244 [Escherichia coli]|nr:hypothetical protein BvCmsHHP056_04244 [Escherichia coli]GDR92121.1 hypothetical protein BvCmsSINP011_04356 [Escherichia coli]
MIENNEEELNLLHSEKKMLPLQMKWVYFKKK